MRLNDELRDRVVMYHYQYQVSHCASSLSVLDILIDVFERMKEGDRIILSKGHASSALYICLERLKYYTFDKPYPNHPKLDPKHDIVCSTGSLGHGLSMGCGMALANRHSKVYVIMGDGELQEGSVDEGLRFAHQHRLSNLVVYVDCNGVQACGKVDSIMGRGQHYVKLIRTIKGKGIPSWENKVESHYRIPNEKDVCEFRNK